ncbi:hypothetical protein SCG7086_AV_00040 [Chlamydiales bacterium SCGC AG-110-P3]|nr:hypothetical protein SCG7086_AV_00040 [Chlamydiales bacterium SCGC AG-110-P3]
MGFEQPSSFLGLMKASLLSKDPESKCELFRHLNNVTF